MGSVALITGGSRGIGLGIAYALAREGYHLAINGIRPENDIHNTLEELRGLDVEVKYIQSNIGIQAERQGILDEVLNEFDHINVLINNAGVAPRERIDLLHMTEESYDRVMDINLKGALFLTQQIALHMIDKSKSNSEYRGCIINISSISAEIASPSRAEYCISKAGMSMMTRLYASLLGGHSIPVYEIRPGIIRTDMTTGVIPKYDQLIQEGLTIQPGWGTPEDVGKAVAALVRGDFPYSTGQVFMVDGGLTVPRL